jgi:hypothetical protein
VTKGDILKKAMIEALEKSLGIVTTATKAVGISRKTHYQWLIEDPEYKEEVEDLTNAALDFAESKLFEKITGVEVLTGHDKETGEAITYTQPPSDTAIIFYLKTKGKHRGYIEKQQIENLNERVVLIEKDPDERNKGIDD